MSDFSLYAGREATGVKHQVLEKYLQKLAYKVGSWSSTINYVDGFAGPWKVISEDLADSSPYIAINELRAARDGLIKARRGSPLIRCLFIEKNRDAFLRLKDAVAQFTDVQTYVLNNDFESSIEEILKFASTPSKGFSFFFIDPTGWTGFGMKSIAPILRHTPGEVLINFMTKDIKRFIDDSNSTALPTFIDLFGEEGYREQWHGLQGQDREDAIVERYCEQVKITGQFEFVVSTIVLHPTHDRTHFHLIYATRNVEGLRVFRDVEAQIMEVQNNARSSAQQRRRHAQTGQQELFSAEVIGDGGYLDSLRTRYLRKSKESVLKKLQEAKRISFDDLEKVALIVPLTWTKDLKAWLKEWENRGSVTFEGLNPTARVPQRRMNHYIIWLE